MIKSQWDNTLKSITLPKNNLEIIDYACGQGLASILFFDKFRNTCIDQIKKITLIEPSLISLNRAVTILQCYCPNSKVKKVNKKLDIITRDDLRSDEKMTRFHLFSNILDIDDFDVISLMNKILHNLGSHYLLAVSHDRDFSGGSQRLRDIYDTLNDEKYSKNFKIKESEINTFKCYNGKPAIYFYIKIESYRMDLFSKYDDNLPAFDLPDEAGFSMQWDEDRKGFNIKIPNGELFYSEHFFNQTISDRSVEYFLENDTNNWETADWRQMTDEEFLAINFENIKWKHDCIKLYGKNIPLPRFTSWYGDKGKSYSYSGINSYPNEWNRGLLYIKQQIEKIANVEFNSVLMNWYRDGEDYLNWHSDNEKELGKNPIIGSVNFGATRDFIIRKNDKSTKITIPLKHGTLLVMRGEMQHFWQHSVPKRKTVKDVRFNLTFRIIIN
jgi:alkylated DNA repair dioxygenase AlkB